MNWIYSFRDPADSWLADDKLAHFFGAFTAMCITHSVKTVLIAGVFVELIELYRYHHWLAKGAPSPWPWLTDKISPKDLLCDLAGALAFLLVAWIA